MFDVNLVVEKGASKYCNQSGSSITRPRRGTFIPKISVEEAIISLTRKLIKDLVNEWQGEMILFYCRIQLLIINTYSPFRRKTRLNFFTLVNRGHDDPCLLGDYMHRTNPSAIGDRINNIWV